jgi:hypothetical protein
LRYSIFAQENLGKELLGPRVISSMTATPLFRIFDENESDSSESPVVDDDDFTVDSVPVLNAGVHAGTDGVHAGTEGVPAGNIVVHAGTQADSAGTAAAVSLPSAKKKAKRKKPNDLSQNPRQADSSVTAVSQNPCPAELTVAGLGAAGSTVGSSRPKRGCKSKYGGKNL